MVLGFKKIIPFLSFMLFLFCISCDDKKNTHVSKDVQVTRLDKLFYAKPYESLDTLKRKYPIFFLNQMDSVWVAKRKDTLLQELYKETEKVFSDFTPVEKKLESLIGSNNNLFLEDKISRIVTLVSEVDYANKIVIADSLLIISLDNFLGKDHYFYEGISNYISNTLDKEFLYSDVAMQFAYRKVGYKNWSDFLEWIIYYGKLHYIQSLICDFCTEEQLFAFQKDKYRWLIDNQGYIWGYFIEKKLLFSGDRRLKKRFVDPAPFSKFYLDFDKESPGQVGNWIGFKIVESFMKNNDVSLQSLLNMDARQILERSKYKPKK